VSFSRKGETVKIRPMIKNPYLNADTEYRERKQRELKNAILRAMQREKV